MATFLCTKWASMASWRPPIVCSEGVWKWYCRSSHFWSPTVKMLPAPTITCNSRAPERHGISLKKQRNRSTQFLSFSPTATCSDCTPEPDIRKSCWVSAMLSMLAHTLWACTLLGWAYFRLPSCRPAIVAYPETAVWWFSWN